MLNNNTNLENNKKNDYLPAIIQNSNSNSNSNSNIILNSNSVMYHSPIIIQKKETMQIYGKNFEIRNRNYKIGLNLEIKYKNSFNNVLDEKEISKFRLYEKIIFGFSFNQSVNKKIPSNIISIIFGHNFNMSIDDMIIYENDDQILLEEIILGEKFNHPVNNLPKNLKKIIFGNDFNNEVNNLPTKLEHLEFGYSFNKTINYLPESLEYLLLGFSFNESINDIPTSIKYLAIGNDFNKPIECFPYNLKELKISQKYYNENQIKINDMCNDKFFIIKF